MPKLIETTPGLFWWGDERVPKGHFAPATAVAGDLEVSEDGIASLRLRGMLHRPNNPGFGNIFSREPLDRKICGILSAKGEGVYLSKISPNGGSFQSFSPNTESYIAYHCLISPTFHLFRNRISILSITFAFEDYDDWMWMHNIHVKEEGDTWSASYHKSKKHRWKMKKNTLLMRYYLSRPMYGPHSSIKIQEKSYLNYMLRKAIGLEDAQKLSIKIEDFIVLLSDNESGLPFPRLKIRRYKYDVIFYFARTTRKHQDVKFSDSWYQFGSVNKHMGLLLENWINGFDAFGPGFHLYMGNRRGVNLYPEHRFASLVWGLESLSRRKVKISPNKPLEAKIDRITSQIVKPADKKWLSKMLAPLKEPILSDRLDRLFAELPLGLSVIERRKFAEACAKLRNDLSHFGGERTQTIEYTDFLEQIIKVSAALDLLYHARLLVAIGADKHRLLWWFTEGFKSYQIKRTLEAVGLNTLAKYDPNGL